MKLTAALALLLSLAGGTFVAQDGTVRSLMSKDLTGVPGRELAITWFHARRIQSRAYASCAVAGLRPGRGDRDAGQRWARRHVVAGPDLV